jgi:hypothetical protein
MPRISMGRVPRKATNAPQSIPRVAQTRREYLNPRCNTFRRAKVFAYRDRDVLALSAFPALSAIPAFLLAT